MDQWPWMAQVKVEVERRGAIYGESALKEDEGTLRRKRSIFDENRSMFGGNRSIFGGNRSMFGGNRSMFGGNRSIFGGSRSAYVETESDFWAGQTVFDEKYYKYCSASIIGSQWVLSSARCLK